MPENVSPIDESRSGERSSRKEILPNAEKMSQVPRIAIEAANERTPCLSLSLCMVVLCLIVPPTASSKPITRDR